MGPCLCGDLRCRSCGPAQGNHRCYVCGKWDDEGGCTTPAECGAKMEQWARDEERWEREEAENEEREALRAVRKGEWQNDDGGI